MTNEKTNAITTLSAIKDPVPFISKCIPNWNEIRINAISKATMDTFLGRFSLIFGDNPTAAAIYRDTLKIQISYSLNGTEIDNTGIYHDEGGIYAAITKTSCKATLLLSYSSSPSFQEYVIEKVQLKYPNINEDNAKEIAFEWVARAGNYVCEVPARFLNIASRERQLMEKHSPNEMKKEFYTFIQKDSKLLWSAEAIGEGISKTFAADQTGEFIKYLGYAGYIRQGTNMIDNAVALFLGGDMNYFFQPKDDIYTKFYKSGAMFHFNLLDPKLHLTCTVITVVDWMGNVFKEVINTGVFISITKSVQDFLGIVINDITNLLGVDSAIELE